MLTVGQPIANCQRNKQEVPVFMKQFRIVLSMVLSILILLSLCMFSNAENTEDTVWQADILKLIDANDVPQTASVTYDYDMASGTSLTQKHYYCELVSSQGDVLNVAFDFMLNGVLYSDAQWEEVTQWLKQLVTDSVQHVQADAESLVNVVAQAYATQRNSAQPNADGTLPQWAQSGLMIQNITASVPYYPELSNGINGDATQRLQQKLIQLGYLDDKADGYFGNNTKAAVEALERYVQQLEQDVIDALPTPEVTATPMPTATPNPGELPTVMDIPLDAETPESTLAPATPVDGVAEPLLQAYLFSDSFKIARRELQNGDSGDDVLRLQRRLKSLGYMTDSADGAYGGSTARSVRIFQYYNNLSQTGIADLTTQQLLFSESAQQPDNSMLTVGSSGDAVSKLQKRLRVLGFANISVDGDFGSSTRTGVENLQKYMQAMEQEALAATNVGQDVSNLTTIEVNGIADPMLLDDFYDDAFPAIPAAMSSGSSGLDVVRLQRRLNCLEYYYSSLDGQYGSGTAKAVTEFQKRHGLPQTGEADTITLSTLFNENALKALKPYVLKISTEKQRVYAYGLDSNNEYTVLVRTMKCSTGKDATPTPKGTYQNSTGPGARWHYFKKFKCWAQYAYYIQGDIMFHSVLYNQKDGPVTQSSVNNLGRKASHGCVRLSVEDAKWIWNNCPTNTKIIVY